MAKDFSISFLNHASIIIKAKEVSILMDPWFDGYCFKNGWGLAYQNKTALNEAATATHLWISHFHADHLHVPTLKKICALNPHIQIYANDSANFNMSSALKKIGFLNVTSLLERKSTWINQDIELIRAPATGIDNMLFVKIYGKTILNYNDCNLPVAAIEALNKKYGPVDLLLSNFNHASKLMEFPVRSVDTIKKDQIHNYRSIANAWGAKILLPFASYHYYRSQEGFEQNDSLMTPLEISQTDSRALHWEIGETLSFDENLHSTKSWSHQVQAYQRTINPLQTTPTSEEALLKAANQFAKKMNINFFGATLLLKDFYIYAYDLKKCLRIHFWGSSSLVSGIPADCAVEAQSGAILSWIGDVYGTDSFNGGAHYRLLNTHLFKLRVLLLLSILTENELSPLRILKMLTKKSGWLFFWNRREEISALLLKRNFKIGNRSL